MSNRDAFLARVRQAAELGRQYRVHLQPVADEIGYVGAGGDLCQRFAEEVNAVGGQSVIVADVLEACEQLRLLLTEAGAKSASVWQHELLDRLGLTHLLESAGVTALDYRSLLELSPDEQRRRLLACDVGITSCDCSIAETGTLMMCSKPGHERVASLLPPMHIAIIERRQIVPDLIDAFRILESHGLNALPSNVTFITGPSKTGDIELQLTTGVHGPGKWWVIVVDDEGTGGNDDRAMRTSY
jgi:L-lactate dehydrogenase complex protein LldG